MAVNQQAYPVPYEAVVLGANPASYTSGGTSLGPANSPAMVAYGLQGAPVYQPWSRAGAVPTGYRFTGDTVTLDVVLYERTAAALALQMHGDSSSTLIGVPSFKPGHLIDYTSDDVTVLMLRAVDGNGDFDATRPSLLLPAAVCINIGPIQWDQGGMMREACVLTMLGLWHGGLETARLEGDPGDWPAWPE